MRASPFLPALPLLAAIIELRQGRLQMVTCRLSARDNGACGKTQEHQSAPSPTEAAWAASETGRVLRGLPPESLPDDQLMKALAGIRQPLVIYLSPIRRCGLYTNVHLQEAADVEQLLHMLLAAGLSFPQLASYVANGTLQSAKMLQMCSCGSIYCSKRATSLPRSLPKAAAMS